MDEVVTQTRQQAIAQTAAEQREAQQIAQQASEHAAQADTEHKQTADTAYQRISQRTRTEDYGPWRRVRHSYKSPPEYLHPRDNKTDATTEQEATTEPALYRPPGMTQEDFAEMLTHLPEMIEEATTAGEPLPGDRRRSSPRGPSTKREASSDKTAEPPEHRSRTDNTENEDEALLVQQANSSVPIANQWEVLLAGFLQKQNSTEIKAFGNEESLQLEIDESKRGEWETLEGKTAVRVWKGAKAAAIRQKYGHRFIGSRFVVIRKTDEDGTRIKSRWCLQGHLDPDFRAKILSGACHSPTLHPLSRALVAALRNARSGESPSLDSAAPQSACLRIRNEPSHSRKRTVRAGNEIESSQKARIKHQLNKSDHAYEINTTRKALRTI